MKSTKLDNGLEIITDKRDEEFVTIAYYVNKGSFDEPTDRLGIAHMAEHMVFKGTVNRDKDELWRDIEQYGGEMNAFTSYQCTTFYCTILGEYWKTALDVLSDIIWNNTVPEDEFDLEKSVIMEELKMYYDDGQSRVIDLLNSTRYAETKNHCLNAGTVETVSKISREQLLEFIHNFYIPNNIKIVVTGDVEHNKIVDFVKDYISDYVFKKTTEEYYQNIKKMKVQDAEESMDITQSHMICYMPLNIKTEKDIYMADIVSQALSGGFGSRLMEIREKYGYAYTVRTSVWYMKNEMSAFECYVGLNYKNIDKTKELILKNYADVIKDGITEKEFNSAKICFLAFIKKNDIFCEDANESKIISITDGLSYDYDKNVKLINSITLKDVNKFIKKNFDIENCGFIVIKQTK